MYYYILYAVLAFLLSFIPAYIVFPRFIRKMKQLKNTGRDVNKRDKPEIPEMGGIVCVFSFSLAMFIIAGLASLLNQHEDIILPLQAAMTVFIAAAIIGFIDDIGLLSRRRKAALIIFAAAPMVFLRPASPRLDLILGTINFTGFSPWGFDLLLLLFWALIVPLGIMASANAFNMAAGYNGLESGIAIITSSFMALITLIKGANHGSTLIFLGLAGAATALWVFNRFPSKVFVGDIGTLGFGATYAVGAIIGNVAIYAVIAIIPMFFEFFSTVHYTFIKRIERRTACHNPKIKKDGRIIPPKGCKYYTLAFYILDRYPDTEKRLVKCILAIYISSGLIALLLVCLQIDPNSVLGR